MSTRGAVVVLPEGGFFFLTWPGLLHWSGGAAARPLAGVRVPPVSWIADPEEIAPLHGWRRMARMRKKSGGGGRTGSPRSAATVPSFHRGKAFRRRPRLDGGAHRRHPSAWGDRGCGGNPHPEEEGRENHSQSVAPWGQAEPQVVRWEIRGRTVRQERPARRPRPHP